jgi:hypothetical protein
MRFCNGFFRLLGHPGNPVFGPDLQGLQIYFFGGAKPDKKTGFFPSIYPRL